MENKIYIIVVCMLAVDLFSLLFIPMIRSAIKKYNKELNENFRDVREMLHGLDKRQSGMHLELVELNVETKSRRTNPHYEETKKAINSILDGMEQLSKNQGVLNTRLQHTEAIINTLKEVQHQYEELKISKDTTHLKIQVDELAKERESLKSQIERLKKKNKNSIVYGTNKKYTTNEECIEALKISHPTPINAESVWQTLSVPMPKEHLTNLGIPMPQKDFNPLEVSMPKEDLTNLGEPKKKKKYSYHAYNTPERMRELRRLKALKKGEGDSTTELKNEVEKIKRKVGRPKGSKKNNNK
jgi:hypothetical protein